MIRKIFQALLGCISCILCILLLNGCSAKPVSEKSILADIEATAEIQELNVNITDFSILRRQTVPEDRVDEVYALIQGSNSDYKIQRCYHLQYALYNEGWHLENITLYDEEEYPFYVTPLHGPADELLQKYAEAFDYNSIASYPNSVLNPNSILDMQYGTWENTETVLDEFSPYAVYTNNVTYTYELYSEVVELTTTFYFQEKPYMDNHITLDDTLPWGWCAYTNNLETNRKAILNHEAIIGTWHYNADDYILSRIEDVTLHISDITDDQFTLTTNFGAFGSDPQSAPHTDTATVKLNKSGNTDKIKSIQLIWNNENVRYHYFIYPTCIGVQNGIYDGSFHYRLDKIK